MLSPLLFSVLAPLAGSLVLAAGTPNVLIYTATTGFRHDSIPTAVQALQAQAERANVNFTHTEDGTRFNDEELATYDGVVFLSTTGDVLNKRQLAAFQSWLNKGGNFVGIHAATACLMETDFYVREIGAVFDYHPEFQMATIDVIGPSHPSTDHLPKAWNVHDEIYNFQSDPRKLGAVVILSADMSSYVDFPQDPIQGTPHPTAWIQERGAGVEEGGTAGRSFYTSLGHANETWQSDDFINHILGGISWVLDSTTTRAFNASGLVGAMYVEPTPDSDSEKEASPTGEGMGQAVATEDGPEGYVLLL
ncbi:class I glutamine amidotransferase-like protein [Pterulicium gracile]|uniref:Class I glutamine amidotransferase-like protein n=1 Tax=Pterulicium gracile TaxID=1884261 RepID=A0A5C3QAU9_9AGAR|nr:class I glutamine amidotransferase-like protein [Pterula gracilis]